MFGFYRVHPEQQTSDGVGSDNLALGHGAGVVTLESTTNDLNGVVVRK